MPKRPKLRAAVKTKILESRIKKYVKDRLDELGAYHFWPVQMGLGKATLDCLGCYKGRFFAIETKRPGEKPTTRQAITMGEMRGAGAAVFVVDSEQSALSLFAEKSNEGIDNIP